MNDCAHHWILESPTGGTFVTGRCRKCGVERGDFRAGLASDVDWMLKRDGYARRAESRAMYAL